jgi:hypothetical protein
MYRWTSSLVVGAALLAGCTGTIGDRQTGASTGNGGSGPGSGDAGSPGQTGIAGGPGAGPGAAGSGQVTGAAGMAMTGPPPTTCTPGVPVTSQLPRLTRAQYDNTARDLLFIDVQPSQMLAPDTIGSVDQRAWDGFQAAADALATQVMANATATAKVIPCTTDNATCAMQFITTFGKRAFRRPLTSTEVSRFMTLYTNKAMITQNGTLDQINQVLIKSFLMSPSFITKEELSETTPNGANYALNSYEVASRLSYLIWGSMPDDMLFAAAEANKLQATADILSQAQRLLKDPRARTKVADFHATYALMGQASRWSAAAHDATLFPAFKPSMVPALADEAARFFDYITFDYNSGAGTFQDLILKPVAFVSKDLAPIYGLDATKFTATPALTTLDATQRAGVFTQAGWLASYSSYDRTSPILRGAFIEKQVLCREIPAPPPGAANMPLPTTGSTNRERVSAQTSNEACAGCHAEVVNPAGFAMEGFDSIGMLQTKEKVGGAAIDSTADVAIGSAKVHVNGALDLMKAIAASPEGQSCYAQRWVTYAYERDLTAQDVCTVQSLAGKMSGSGYTIQRLVTDLTQSDSFRYRAKGAL